MKINHLLVFVLLIIGSCGPQEQSQFYPNEYFDIPSPAENQKHALGLKVDPIDTVRIAIIGLGNRGKQAVNRLTFIDNVEIVALADVIPDNVEKSQQILLEKGMNGAELYTGPEDWKTICERDDVDLVYICTHWDLHTPIAVYAMEQGKHAAIEVPAALTIDECWQLVNTAERTQRHCIQLENCIYDFFEITSLNMAQKGLFGEIVHVEGAYIHDLRALNFSDTYYWDYWRLNHLESTDGNPYPTHGLGPISHILDIHRGDKMDYLVSMSSDQFGMTEYAKDKYGSNSEMAQRDYRKGDMNTTLIKTAKGKTIMLQHDVTSPRPYSRLHAVSGTKGFTQKYPKKGIALEPDAHRFLTDEKMDSILAEYEMPMVTEIKAKAKEVGGHGGMDFIMDYRLIYCLRNGLPLDQDVYDAAEWSAIVELSKISVENHSMPIKVPDFTRGRWEELDGVKYHLR